MKHERVIESLEPVLQPAAAAPILRSPSNRMGLPPSSATVLRSVLIIVATWIPFANFVHADDWPQWRGIKRDGVSAETGWVATWPESGARVLWKAEIGKGCSSVAVVRGHLYTMGNVADGGTTRDVIWCLNAETGEVIWKYSYPQPLDPSGFEGGPCVTPCVEAARVYTLNKRGRAFCLDALTGKVLWDTNPDETIAMNDSRGFNGGFTASPLVQQGLVITGAAALDKQTGKLVWQLSPTEACQWASPVVWMHDGRPSVLCFNTRGLSCIDMADGSSTWRFPLASDACSAGADPVVHGDRILLSTCRLRRGDPATMLLDITSTGPTPVWKRADIVSNFQERVVWQDHVYGCDAHQKTRGDATLKCVDLRTGDIMWSQPEFDWGQLSASDGKLLVIRRGELYVVEATPKHFRLLARTKVVRNTDTTIGATAVAPVLANGLLYCRGPTGDLVCLDLRP